MKDPNDTDPIENEEDEPNHGPDPAAQEVIESLPAYKEYMRERRNEMDGLTFGDY
jgi:hypothetical protein